MFTAEEERAWANVFACSVHSGTTRGSIKKIWPQADSEGFGVVVNTMLRFGILAFCE